MDDGIPLRDFVDRLFFIHDQRHEAEGKQVQIATERANESDTAIREHLQLPVHPGAAARLEDQEKRIRELERWRQETAGIRGGEVNTRTLVFASVAALVGIIGIVLAIFERIATR